MKDVKNTYLMYKTKRTDSQVVKDAGFTYQSFGFAGANPAPSITKTINSIKIIIEI